MRDTDDPYPGKGDPIRIKKRSQRSPPRPMSASAGASAWAAAPTADTADSDNPTPKATGSPADTGSPPKSAPAAGATAATPTADTSVAGSAPAPQWKRLAPMNTIRREARGLFVNDHQFLVIGGMDDRGNALSSCEYYDTKTEMWTNLSIDMPTPRTKFGVACIGNRVFVMGGISDSAEGTARVRSDLISMDLLGGDLSTLGEQKWESLAPMKQARHSFACVSHQLVLYVFGGFGIGSDERDNVLDTVERYNTKSKQWTRLPPMPGGARFECAAGVVGDQIFVVGGFGDIIGKELRSTIVFDTWTQGWESSTASSTLGDTKDPASTPIVPAMNKSRCWFLVVVVEQFVIAIGGALGSTQPGSIEVLDTQRNDWNFSPIAIEENLRGFVAGFCQDTKEIIVAGGFASVELEAGGSASVDGHGDDAVWSILFETELLPLGFRLKERGQKVEGDKERGEDQLGTGIIADVLAEMISFKDLDPPFAVGFLGRWGNGKTFFLNLILDYIVKLQKKKADKLFKEQFVGHIYVVMFSAWTYSKGDIFSSLMFEILKTLNEQLQFEQAVAERVGQDELVNGKVSTLEVFRDFSKGEIEYTKKHGKVLQQCYMEAKKNGDSASAILLEAINANYEEDQTKMSEIKKEIEGFQQQHKNILEKNIQKRIQKLARESVVNIQQVIKEHALKLILTKISESAPSSSNEDKSIDDLINTFKDVEDYKKLMESINSTKVRDYKFQWTNIPIHVWICSTSFLILAFIISQQFEKGTITTCMTTITALVAPIFPFIESIFLAKKRIDPIVKEIRSKVTAVEDVGTLLENEELKKNEKKLRDQETELHKIENRVHAVEGFSLRESINRIEKQKYENKLGIVHAIDQDLQSMTEGMMNKQRSKDIFPRGEPRIVLFVDDLDRCDKDTVVEVIEALQLLIKTKLFVAILAIDPRYVTSSLEKHYQGILHQNVPPTGMDFLEKIIQIPFRLPGVDQGYVETFVGSQIDVFESEDSSTKPKVVADLPRNDILGLGLGLDDDIDFGAISSSSSVSSNKSGHGQAKQAQGEALPSKRVFFTKEEKIMIQDTFKLFGVGPRCMRRIINVFKLLQVIWKRDTMNRFKKDKEMKRATLFVMLLAAEESTRDATYTVFEWMGQGNVKYHRVMCDGEGNRLTENNLAQLFKTELLKRDKSLNFSSSGKNEGFLMDYIDEYLTDYKWTDVQGWKDVSSDFFLARSFSFFRLTPENFE